MGNIYRNRKLKTPPSPTYKERGSIIAFFLKPFPTGFSRLCKAEENSFTTLPFLHDNGISSPTCFERICTTSLATSSLLLGCKYWQSSQRLPSRGCFLKHDLPSIPGTRKKAIDKKEIV
ncbi:hypothetical protein CDAR_382881 [Caerostris darwini]|uniref:Uncharacterized protein n=1 Tax=Caerostris darwini TaxID=1538125 RepID=A0AAV4SGL4_9ARAC|nr:hypothetical protein CDAR_382881 [Caerostris darwini]